MVRSAAAGPHPSADAARLAAADSAGRAARVCALSDCAITICRRQTSGAAPWGSARRSASCKASSCRPGPGSSACSRRESPSTIPQWLDHLFLSGEVVWGRLNPPRRDDDEPPSMAALTRVVPISLVLREELPLLLSPDRACQSGALRGGGQAVLDALTSRGALFFSELKVLTQLLPGHLEEALRELAASGLITSDAFAAVRKIVDGEKPTRSRRRTRGALHGVAAPIGRWSLFPGPVTASSREQYLDAWCRQLLRRWGVLFRDLLARETSAPSWQDLVGTLRRLELRGEVRGGRFVSRVAGEQYALPAAVELLREVRCSQPAASRGS